MGRMECMADDSSPGHLTPASGTLRSFSHPATFTHTHASRMLDREHVTVIIPAYNEEATIAAVVSDFRSRAGVDEVLVVDNNCRDKTAELAAAAGARVVSETEAGYGC